jgi:hypothetical protein
VDRRNVLTGFTGLFLSSALTGCARSPTTPSEYSSATSSGPSGAGTASRSGKATAADYAWFQADSWLSEVYSLIWLAGLSPGTVLERLGARTLGQYTWPENGWDDLPGLTNDEAVLAVTHTTGWAIMVAGLGADDVALKRLSKDTRLVADYHNFEADDRFLLCEDGVIQVDFDPSRAASRSGARPDLCLPPCVRSVSTRRTEPTGTCLTRKPPSRLPSGSPASR